MDKQPQSDEINLQELAVRLIRYFRKHARFIAISCVVGTGAGMTGWLALPTVFESKMILMSDILTESYSDRITESLDNLIKEQNLKVLAERLNISESEASQIQQIEIESVKKVKDPVLKEETIFVVTANIKQKEILPKLQEGIIIFLRNNEFVKIRVKHREILFKTMVEKIGREIASLDSLKKRLFEGKPIYAKAGAAEMLLVDPTDIYTQIIELSQKQLEYKNALELANSIQLVEGFTVFEKPTEPKLSLLLVGGFLLGLLVSVGVLSFEQLIKLSRGAE